MATRVLGGKLVRRRIVGSVLLFLVATAGFLWNTAHLLSLGHPKYVSGWMLFGLMVVLLGFNLRKKVPMLPSWLVGRGFVWMEVHAYGGILAAFLFFIHISGRIPNGILEGTLAVLFGVVALTGFVGLYLERRIPHLLSMHGEEVIFERIPRFYRVLQERGQALSLRAMSETKSSAIPDFYLRHLHDFFAGPRNFWMHLRQSRQPIASLEREMQNLDRFLNDDERGLLEEIRGEVQRKHDLDYHYAHQSVLKYWLFFHVPVAYSLMVIVLLHVVLVNSFGGIQ